MTYGRILLLGTCLILSSCRDEVSEIDRGYMVFGSFYGFCGGEQCIEIFKIDQESLWEDTLDLYPNGESLYNGSFVPLSDQDYENVKGLFEVVPVALANENNTVIGMPDAADQGGFYLELTVDGEKRHWLIDQNKQTTPEYLHELMDSLDSKILKLR